MADIVCGRYGIGPLQHCSNCSITGILLILLLLPLLSIILTSQNIAADKTHKICSKIMSGESSVSYKTGLFYVNCVEFKTEVHCSRQYMFGP